MGIGGVRFFPGGSQISARDLQTPEHFLSLLTNCGRGPAAK